MSKQPPNRIYLQWYGDEEPHEDEVFEVSWCEDKIYKHDIEYIRVEKPEITRLHKAIATYNNAKQELHEALKEYPHERFPE